MFNVGAGEMIVIALILLMAVGPEQLPGLIRRVGRTVSEVKGMTEGLRAEFMSGMEEIERATDPEAWAAGNGQPSNVKPRTRPGTPAPGSVADQAEKSESAADTDQNGSTDDDGDGVEDGPDLDDSVLDEVDQGETKPDAVDDWASKISNGWDTPVTTDEHAFPAADETLPASGAPASDDRQDEAVIADGEGAVSEDAKTTDVERADQDNVEAKGAEESEATDDAGEGSEEQQ